MPSPLPLRLASFVLLFAVVVAPASAADVVPQKATDPITHGPADWPAWRGLHGNGVAASDQSPPVRWSSTENVLWKAPLPGRGHSSPTVVGDRVFIATAEEDREVQSILCFDRQTGRELWRTAVHEGGLERKGHKKSTQASATIASDGRRLFMNFMNSGAIHTTALDFAGKQLWQTKVSDFDMHQGFGSSPTLYGPYAIVATDSRGGGNIAALDRATGKIAWQISRPEKPNYTSTALLHAAGKDQLVIHGCDLVTSLEPATGKKLWEIEGATTECVTSLVTDGQRIFVSGGYPRKHVQAVLADGSGKTAWENTSQVYVPSMVVHQDCLYAVLDPGVATCWKCDTGEELWKERLGGTFTASLVLVGESLYATNEVGQTFIFKARPDKFERVAENKLGDEAYATPAICGSRIYMRVVEKTDGQRQEVLYCLGSK